MVRSQFSTSQHIVRRSPERRSSANGSWTCRRSAPARRSVLMIMNARAALLAAECSGRTARTADARAPAVPVVGGTIGLGQELAQALLHDLLGHVADQAGGLAAVLEDDQGGDAEDAVSHRQLLVLVGVDLCDVDLPVVLVAEALDDGGDQPAGAAPWGPEVDEDGLVSVENLRFEGRFVDRDRGCGCH